MGLCTIVFVLVLLINVTKIVSNTISTYAGYGTTGSDCSGSTCSATSVGLSYPSGVCLDTSNNLYVVDTFNSKVRKVTTTGIISTVLGGGAIYQNGAAGISSSMFYPKGCTVYNSELYVADTNFNTIRKLTSTGLVYTVAGTYANSGATGDGGTATSAKLYYPYDVSFASNGDYYIADYNNYKIRKVTASTKIISTFCGSPTTSAGTSGYTGDGGYCTSATFNRPYAVEVDAANNVYIADYTNMVIRKVDGTTQIVTTIIGNGNAWTFGGGEGAAGTSTTIWYAGGLALDSSNNVYFSDYTNNVVRVYKSKTRTVNTFAGVYDSGTNQYSGDGGAATSARLNKPTAIALDSSSNVYISDTYNYVVRKVTQPSYTLSTNSPSSGPPTRSPTRR